MFIHAEGKEDDLKYGDLACFIRLVQTLLQIIMNMKSALMPTPHFSSSAYAIWLSRMNRYRI